jgi:hypothetical protein
MQLYEGTYRTGLIQGLEDLTGTQSASTSSYTRAVKTRDINLAFDDYQNLVKRVSGTWQADDSNHTKYPNVKFNLVSGQQDYSFTVDEQGNQVQDIYRVECKDSNGVWQLLLPYDEMSEDSALSAQETESGTPHRYYKTANGIFLDRTPNYNSTLGIRMFFTRSPSYFTITNATTDDTTKPGIPNAHHRYLILKPAFWFWLPKDTARANTFFAEIQKIEKEIKGDIADRNRDEVQVMTSESVNPL